MQVREEGGGKGHNRGGGIRSIECWLHKSFWYPDRLNSMLSTWISIMHIRLQFRYALTIAYLDPFSVSEVGMVQT
jgi:hypothetical protein